MSSYPPPPARGRSSVSREHPRATLILVCGILSLVCCGLFTGIPAIVMGKSALSQIRSSGGAISGEGTVKAGWICGIIGTALSVLGFLFYLILGAGMVVGSHP